MRPDCDADASRMHHEFQGIWCPENWNMFEYGWNILEYEWKRFEYLWYILEHQWNSLNMDGMCWNMNGTCWNMNGICCNTDGICWNIDGTCWKMNGICWNIDGVCWNMNGICWNTDGICWIFHHIIHLISTSPYQINNSTRTSYENNDYNSIVNYWFYVQLFLWYVCSRTIVCFIQLFVILFIYTELFVMYMLLYTAKPQATKDY